MPERSLQGRFHGVLNNQEKGIQLRFRDPKLQDFQLRPQRNYESSPDNSTTCFLTNLTRPFFTSA